MSARVLVIRGGALGDFVLTLPLLECVRRLAPGARVEILGYPSIAALAVEGGLADATTPVDALRFSPLFAPGAALPADLRDWLASFDLAVAVWRRADEFLAPKLAAAGVAEWLCVSPLPSAGDRTYDAEHMLRQLPAAWQRGVTATPRLALLHAEHRRRAREWLAARGLASEEAGEDERLPLLIVHPGSGGRGAHRNWPPERFAAICRRAPAELGLRVLVTRGPADDEFADAILREVDVPVAGNLTCVQLAGLLSLAGAYLGNDSGVSHLAAAVGTPAVVLFGVTDPAVWAPRGDNVVALDAGYPQGVAIETIGEDAVAAALTGLPRPRSGS